MARPRFYTQSSYCQNGSYLREERMSKQLLLPLGVHLDGLLIINSWLALHSLLGRMSDQLERVIWMDMKHNGEEVVTVVGTPLGQGVGHKLHELFVLLHMLHQIDHSELVILGDDDGLHLGKW